MALILLNGQRVCMIYKDIDFDTEQFELTGRDFIQTGQVE